MPSMPFETRKKMPPLEKIFCNVCGNNQYHQVAAKHDRSSSEGKVEITRTAEILECCGCGHTTLRRKHHFSEYQYHPGDLDPDPQYVPKRNHRQEPAWLVSIDDNMRAAFSETILAFNQEMLYLSAVGARTVLDMISVSKVGDIGVFEAKLRQLEKDNHITSPERERLDVLAEVGNAAAHRGHKISIEDLGIIIDILEQTTHKLCITPEQDRELSEHAKRIGSNVPPRIRKGA